MNYEVNNQSLNVQLYSKEIDENLKCHDTG